MTKEKLEFESYNKYQVEIIYRSNGNMKKIKSYEADDMDQVKYLIGMYRNEKYDYGYTLEEIKVSITIGWRETFWNSRKNETISDIDKDIESLPAIPFYYKAAEKKRQTDEEIRSSILADAGEDMVDLDYIRMINEELGD